MLSNTWMNVNYFIIVSTCVWDLDPGLSGRKAEKNILLDDSSESFHGRHPR